MSTTTHSLFPVVSEGTIGAGIVQTVDGRELHAFLEVGTAFKDWIARRIADYGFSEGADFCSFLSESGGRPSREYALAIDMAKELSMVERNERGKQARRYFIECERRAKMPLAQVSAIVHSEVAALVPKLIVAALAEQTLSLRRGKTAGQLWRDFGLPRIKGGPTWFGNRLAKMQCQIEGGGRGELGVTTARLFDPDKARTWFTAGGGRYLVETKIAERRGQGRLRLVPAVAEERPL